MKKSKILIIDALINLILGLLLLLLIPFPHQIIHFLGVPEVKYAFYTSIWSNLFVDYSSDPAGDQQC